MADQNQNPGGSDDGFDRQDQDSNQGVDRQQNQQGGQPGGGRDQAGHDQAGHDHAGQDDQTLDDDDGTLGGAAGTRGG